MKRTLALLTAALMASAVASTPVLAQSDSDSSTGTSGGASSNNSTTGAGSNTGTSALDDTDSTDSPGTDTTDSMQGADTESMENSDSMTGDAAAMSPDQMASQLKTTEASSLKVVRPSDSANTDRNAEKSTPPLDTTAEEQQKIQAAIAANSNLSSMLEAQSIELTDVVAASVGADNVVTVYVK